MPSLHFYHFVAAVSFIAVLPSIAVLILAALTTNANQNWNLSLGRYIYGYVPFTLRFIISAASLSTTFGGTYVSLVCIFPRDGRIASSVVKKPIYYVFCALFMVAYWAAAIGVAFQDGFPVALGFDCKSLDKSAQGQPGEFKYLVDICKYSKVWPTLALVCGALWVVILVLAIMDTLLDKRKARGNEREIDPYAENDLTLLNIK